MAPTLDPRICEEMGHCSWHNAGLDVPDSGPLAGELVSVKVCVWCGREKRRRHRAIRLRSRAAA